MKHYHKFFAMCIIMLAFCVMSVFAAEGLNKPNTAKVTYNLVSGETVTNQAEGKAKILIFIQANDPKSRDSAKNICANYSDFSALDIVFIDIKKSSKSVVTNFRNTYAAGANVAFDTTTKSVNSMKEYTRLLIGPAASVPSPFIVYIDKNNKIQNEEHGIKLTVSHAKEIASNYLGVSFNAPVPVTPGLTQNNSINVAGSVSKDYKGITLNGKLLEKTEEVYVKGATVKGKATPYYKPDSSCHWETICCGVFTENRTVTLSSYIISKYEVTQELYSEVMKDQSIEIDGVTYQLSENPSFDQNLVYMDEVKQHRPVANLTWYDAVYFCNVLSEKLGLQKAYYIKIKNVEKRAGVGLNIPHITGAYVKAIKGANGYRLPTEAEWEFAARGGNPNVPAWNNKYNATDSDYEINAYAWTRDQPIDFKGLHEVGKLKPNTLGLYDIAGNVYEWCFDVDENAPKEKKETVTDPFYPKTEFKVPVWDEQGNEIISFNILPYTEESVDSYWDKEVKNKNLSATQMYYLVYMQYCFNGKFVCRGGSNGADKTWSMPYILKTSEGIVSSPRNQAVCGLRLVRNAQ